MEYLRTILPDRGNIQISLDPATWPTKDGEVGLVPHWAVIPDPSQPRQYYDPAALKELGDSIAETGQREVAKVRLLTEKEKECIAKDQKTPRYMLVSGERRWRAAGPGHADLLLFAVLVGSYASYEDQFADAFLMNESREDLEPLDTARSFHRLLHGKCKGNKQALCRFLGKGINHIDRYLSLLNLDPEVAAYMDPKQYPRKQLLKFGTAIALSKLAPADQKRFGARIMAGEGGRSSGEQELWIQQQLLAASGGAHHAVGGYSGRASHVRERIAMLSDLARHKLKALLESTSEEDFSAACEGMSVESLRELERRYTEIAQLTDSMVRRLGKHIANKQTVGQRIAAAIPGMIVVDYYGDDRRPVKGTAISHHRYLQLYDAGRLAWQVENLPMPQGLPAPATLRELESA